MLQASIFFSFFLSVNTASLTWANYALVWVVFLTCFLLTAFWWYCFVFCRATWDLESSCDVMCCERQRRREREREKGEEVKGGACALRLPPRAISTKTCSLPSITHPSVLVSSRSVRTRLFFFLHFLLLHLLQLHLLSLPMVTGAHNMCMMPRWSSSSSSIITLSAPLLPLLFCCGCCWLDYGHNPRGAKVEPPRVSRIGALLQGLGCAPGTSRFLPSFGGEEQESGSRPRRTQSTRGRMPVMRGLLAPQNTFLDTIATRFDGTREYKTCGLVFVSWFFVSVLINIMSHVYYITRATTDRFYR